MREREFSRIWKIRKSKYGLKIWRFEFRIIEIK